ncbi:hypothetical protein N9C39_11525 [Luminiphilus sp.]|nr:hypothetical protein [Luminiphilus sp.]
MHTTPSNTTDVTYLKIEHYSGHAEVIKAAEVLLEQYKRDVEQERLNALPSWTSAARKLIASLWIREDDSFRFGTKNEYFNSRNRQQVWLTSKTLKLFKTARKLGWMVETQAAVPPRYSKKSDGGLAAVYARTPAFLQLLKSLSVDDVEVDKDLPWVQLKDNEGNILSLPSGYLESESYRRTVSVLQSQYTLLMSTNIYKLIGSNPSPVDPIDIRYTRQWKGNTGIGGRFYSPFCIYQKEDRLSITINGEPVGSWDFSQLHPTLLLLLEHGVGEEPNLFSTGDPYDMPEYPQLTRSTNKRFINTILNAKSRSAAVKSIGSAHQYWDLFENKWVVETYSGRQKRQGEPLWPEKPQKKAGEYIDAFLFRHPAFADVAFKGLWGTLQLLDSQIMEEAVHRATEKGIPVLPVHDELVGPVSKKAEIKQILIHSFHEVTQGKFSDHEPKLSWSAT